MSYEEGRSRGMETNFAASVEFKKETKFDESIIHECELAERFMEVDSVLLEDTHPAVVYLQERVSVLFPQETVKVRISLSDDEPNALSFAHGVVVVSKGLLNLLETQDELDFVLAHEVVHYVRGHVFEIQQVISKTKNSLSPQQIVKDEIEILGAKRFAEYEADIRGVLAQTEGGINPVAARNVFLKIDEYEKKHHLKGTSLEHGSNILRMVNIGTLVSLYDTTASVAEQTPLPDFIKEVGKAKREKSLLTKLNQLSELKEISVLVKESTFFELCLTLYKTLYKRKIIDKDPHKRRQSENYEAFEKAATNAMLETLRTTFPDLSPQEQKALLHGVLTIVVGVENHDYPKANYNKYIKTFESDLEHEDIERLKSVVCKENFEKLGVVIPQGDGMSQYFEAFRLAAMENELFVNDDGEFDRQAFFAFFTSSYTHFNGISTSLGFGALDKNELGKWAFAEILLNLDMKKIKDKTSVVKDIIRDFAKAGILIDIFSVKEILQKQAHLSLEADDINDIENIFGEVDARYKIWQKLFIPNTEPQRIKFLDDRIQKIIRKSLSFSETIEISGVTSVEELKAFVHWILSYAKEQNLWEVEDFVSDFLGQLAKQGASFLPSQRVERYEILLFIAQQVSKEIGTKFWSIFVLDEILIQKHNDTNKISLTDGETLDLIDGVIKILDGTHHFYTDKKFSPAESYFLENRVEKYDYDSEDKTYDHETILRMIIMIFLEKVSKNLSDSKEKISKEELASRLKQVIDFVFQYRDTIPVTQENVNFLEYVFAGYSLSLSDGGDQDFLLYLSTLIPDPGVRERFQQALLPKLYKGKDFDEKLGILFQNPLTRGSVNKEEREKFIEKEVQTLPQGQQVQDAVLSQIDSSLKYEKVGQVAMVEYMYRLLPPATRIEQKKKLFSLMMESHESDEKILEVLFCNSADIDDLGEVEMTKNDAKFHMIRAQQRKDQIFYMNDLTRYAVIRELLLGESGFLMVERQKKWLLEYLWERFVSKSETENGQLSDVVREILKTVLEQAEPDIAFFMLAPFLHERAFRPTQNGTSWSSVVETNFREDYYDKKEKNILLEAAGDVEEKKFLSTEELRKVENKFGGVGEHGLSAFDCSPITAHIEKIILNEGDGDSSPHFEKISLERFIIKIAETLGAPGVRFLQILGQYVDLPPSLEKIFDDAYDNIKRQSKLTSMHTIEREWPEFSSQVKYLKERKGGGSLMTSYEAEMTSGEKRIVKVLNANAVLFVKQSMKVLRKVFTSLAGKQPERYTVALLALDEIETWILEDIEYDTFIAFDKEFYAMHNGKQYPSHEYSITVPKSESIHKEGTDNVYVKVEEFIDGETLVRAHLSLEERKDIASTLVKNYVEQLIIPMTLQDPHSGEQRQVSLVHADVHPGNFMVCKKDSKKCIAIIDRNNFIELDDKDRDFLQGILFGDPSARMDMLLEYILPLTLVVDKETMKQKLEHIFSQSKDISKAMTEVLLECKRLHVKLPLKLTLLAKNLHGLQKICIQAGFRSMVEAFSYSPV